MKSLGISFWYAAVALGSCLTAIGFAEERVSDTTSGKSAAPLCRCTDDSTGATGKILQRLTEPLNSNNGMDFADEPLTNVANFLQDEYNIPIQLDVTALENIGVAPDETVSIAVNNISLGAAIRLLLEPKGLAYVVRNEVLLITSKEAADRELVTCVYDVRDIIAQLTLPAQGGAPPGPDYDSLIDAIVSCVATETWAECGGGEAEIRPLPPGLLTISQTRDVHAEILALLARIRETLQQPTPGSANKPAVGAMGRGMEGMADGMMGMGETQPEPTPEEETPFD